jgi:hypothetical protein
LKVLLLAVNTVAGVEGCTPAAKTGTGCPVEC